MHMLTADELTSFMKKELTNAARSEEPDVHMAKLGDAISARFGNGFMCLGKARVIENPAGEGKLFVGVFQSDEKTELKTVTVSSFSTYVVDAIRAVLPSKQFPASDIAAIQARFSKGFVLLPAKFRQLDVTSPLFDEEPEKTTSKKTQSLDDGGPPPAKKPRIAKEKVGKKTGSDKNDDDHDDGDDAKPGPASGHASSSSTPVVKAAVMPKGTAVATEGDEDADPTNEDRFKQFKTEEAIKCGKRFYPPPSGKAVKGFAPYNTTIHERPVVVVRECDGSGICKEKGKLVWGKTGRRIFFVRDGCAEDGWLCVGYLGGSKEMPVVYDFLVPTAKEKKKDGQIKHPYIMDLYYYHKGLQLYLRKTAENHGFLPKSVPAVINEETFANPTFAPVVPVERLSKGPMPDALGALKQASVDLNPPKPKKNIQVQRKEFSKTPSDKKRRKISKKPTSASDFIDDEADESECDGEGSGDDEEGDGEEEEDEDEDEEEEADDSGPDED